MKRGKERDRVGRGTARDQKVKLELEFLKS